MSGSLMTKSSLVGVLISIMPIAATADSTVALIDRENPLIPAAAIDRVQMYHWDCESFASRVDDYVAQGKKTIATTIWCGERGTYALDNAVASGVNVLLIEPLAGAPPLPNSTSHPNYKFVGFDEALSEPFVNLLASEFSIDRTEVYRYGLLYGCQWQDSGLGFVGNGDRPRFVISHCPDYAAPGQMPSLSAYQTAVSIFLNELSALGGEGDSFGSSWAAAGVPSEFVSPNGSVIFPSRFTLFFRESGEGADMWSDEATGFQEGIDENKIQELRAKLSAMLCVNCGGSTEYCSTSCPKECGNACERCGNDKSGYGCTKSGIIVP
jgi:hypothetical protein